MTVTYCAKDSDFKIMVEPNYIGSFEVLEMDMGMAGIERSPSDSLWLVPGTFTAED